VLGDVSFVHPACFASRVWFWGFTFGFALRRIALLCGVFVRLHLTLVPAGGPFLPSLYVQVYVQVRGLARPSAEVV
jgi:hypothetical protein